MKWTLDLRLLRRWLWRVMSPGMWRRLDRQNFTHVSEERLVSDFRAEEEHK
jgi:hypothetical protein